MKGLHSLEDLLQHELTDLLSAERQLVKALPKMAKAAESDELRNALEKHLGETEEQVRRLEEVFSMLGVRPGRKVCEGMRSLIEEGNEIIQEDGDPDVLDAGIIAHAQRIEHYEIAGYGCVQTFAKILGQNEVADLLQQTLDEEHAADDTLNDIALRSINEQAAQKGEESEMDEETWAEPEPQGAARGRNSRRSTAARKRSGRRS